MAKEIEKTEKVEQAFEVKFSKNQLVSSSRYKDNIDLVNTVLEGDKEYSLAEVDELIEKYMKGKVN